MAFWTLVLATLIFVFCSAVIFKSSWTDFSVDSMNVDTAMGRPEGNGGPPPGGAGGWDLAGESQSGTRTNERSTDVRMTVLSENMFEDCFVSAALRLVTKTVKNRRAK
jgi:hypothetical protein